MVGRVEDGRVRKHQVEHLLELLQRAQLSVLDLGADRRQINRAKVGYSKFPVDFGVTLQ